MHVSCAICYSDNSTKVWPGVKRKFRFCRIGARSHVISPEGQIGFIAFVASGFGQYGIKWRIWEMPYISLHWRHNGHDGVSNHQPHGCLLNRLFGRRSKKTSKLRVTGLCGGNSPGPVNSPHKGPVTRNMFPFDDVIMDAKYALGLDRPIGFPIHFFHPEAISSAIFRHNPNSRSYFWIVVFILIGCTT